MSNAKANAVDTKALVITEVTKPITPKGTKVANEKAADINVGSMSTAELTKLVETATAALVAKRSNEIAGFADAYLHKVEAAGFTVQEALEAVRKLLPASAVAASAATAPKAPKEGVTPRYNTLDKCKKGVTYKYTGSDGKEVTWTSQGGAPKKEFAKLVEQTESKLFSQFEVA